MGSRAEARKNSPLRSSRLDREKAVPISAGGGRSLIEVRERSSTDSVEKPKIEKKKGAQPEELVKYMSNLPSYLQRPESGAEIAQALNFGVLDWGRLEKWKYEQKRVPVRGNGSKRSSAPTSAPSTSATPPPASSFAKSTSTGKPEVSNLGRRPSSRGYDLSLSREDKQSISRDRSGAQFKASPHKRPEPGPGSSLLRNHALKETMKTPDGEVKRRMAHLRKMGIGVPGERESVSVRHRWPEDWEGHESPAADHGGVMVANRLSLADDDLEFQFGARTSDVSYSCPLPCEFQTSKWPDVDLSTPVGVQVTKTLSNRKLYSSPSSDEKPSTRNVERRECALDLGKQPGLEIADKVSRRDATPPNSQFNRLGRSFSSKEVSSAQGLDFAKAGSALADCTKEKPKVGGRSRQSPLRRLLDQVLKPKQTSSLQEHELPDTPTSDGARKSLNLPPDAPPSASQAVNAISSTSEGLQDENHPPSSVNALLQVSYKDGIPLFTFASTGEGGILIARRKKVFISGKDDFEWIYTFYSVQEVKKKGARWMMHQGRKGKKFVTRIMGQMKVPTDSQNLEMVREFILFGADSSEAGHEALEFLPNNELAAIVINFPRRKQPADACSDLCQTKSTHGEPYMDFSSVTVILPSGVHGLPTADGVPSPLIDRWRSGGSCDCGGWDLGCTLTILDNQDQPDSTSSRAFFMSDDAPLLDLFEKVGPPESKHAFTFAASKEGIFSVDFGSSMSLLQAFSICIAILHGLPANHSEFCDLPEGKAAVGPILSTDEFKASAETQRDARASYVSSPPISPVARA